MKNSRRVSHLGFVLAGLTVGTVSLALSASGVLGASNRPETRAQYESAAERAEMPQGKQDAIAAEQARNPQQVPLGNQQRERWSSFGDSGSDELVEEVRAALPQLEETRSNAFAMPPVADRASASAIAEQVARTGKITTADRALAETVGRGDSARAATTKRVSEALASAGEYTSSDALNEEVAAVVAAYDDPTFPGYSQSRFIVDKWIGIEIKENGARVLLDAHQEYDRNPDPTGLLPTGEAVDPTRRWQVTLVKTGSGWKIVDQVQHDLDG